MERIKKYTNLEESTFIIALIYLDRFCELMEVKLTRFNIHRLFLTSVVLAIKYNEDNYFANSYYAKVGGITRLELNIMEEAYIKGMRYTLFVLDDIYNKYEDYLIQFLNMGNKKNLSEESN